jgi:hypothetical protein
VPPDRKPFKNPLTQASTSASTLPTTETSTLPATKTATETSTVPSTYTSTSHIPARRKRGEKAFERTHERITLWLDTSLKARFEALADSEGMAKSTLLDEAITDLLNKYQP